ncbi:MAG: hypothetical protein WCS37_03315 [Chloroflexota bacterium]
MKLIGNVFFAILTSSVFYLTCATYVLASSLLLVLPVWLLWNIVMPGFLPLGELDFWRAWGLVILARIIFQGITLPDWLKEFLELVNSGGTKPSGDKEVQEDEPQVTYKSKAKRSPVVIIEPDMLDAVLGRGESSNSNKNVTSPLLPPRPRRRRK